MSVYDRFYRVVRQVPRGRVITYGSVAALAGLPGRARQVGYALAATPDHLDLPWHRVLNARGAISRRRGAPEHERLQRVLLEAEGVVFGPSERVDLDVFGWP